MNKEKPFLLREEWTFQGGATCKRYIGHILIDTKYYDEPPIIWIKQTHELTAEEAEAIRRGAK